MSGITKGGPAPGGAVSDGRERRRHERIPIRFRAVSRDAAGNAVRGLSINLSSSGLLAAFPVELPLGEEVSLTLALPDGAGSVEVRALPLRVEAPPSGGPPFRIAFHFIQPPDDDVRRLRRLIHAD